MTAKKATNKPLDDTPGLNDYMAKLRHPLKAEAEALRSIILNADPKVTEGVKWNSPSFYYKADLVVINLHAQDVLRLVFVAGAKIPDDTGLLEGDYKDGRRLAYFKSIAEVASRKGALELAVQNWVKLMDQ